MHSSKTLAKIALRYITKHGPITTSKLREILGWPPGAASKALPLLAARGCIKSAGTEPEGYLQVHLWMATGTPLEPRGRQRELAVKARTSLWDVWAYKTEAANVR